MKLSNQAVAAYDTFFVEIIYFCFNADVNNVDTYKVGVDSFLLKW